MPGLNVSVSDADERAKLAALRAAADLGIAALERGDFSEFSDAGALAEYLDGIVARVRTGSD